MIAVAFHVVQVMPDGLAQLRSRLSHPLEMSGERDRRILDVFCVNREKQILLVAEVGINRSFVDSGLFCDLGYGGFNKAFLGKKAFGGFENTFSVGLPSQNKSPLELFNL